MNLKEKRYLKNVEWTQKSLIMSRLQLRSQFFFYEKISVVRF